MNSGECQIVAHSEKQAMDWSLVLASQDIPATILKSEESNQWMLLVESMDYERARNAISQFRLENRGWSWRQKLSWPPVIFHSGAILVCIWLAIIYWLSTVRIPGMSAVGEMDSSRVFGGEWWRLCTAITLHADLGHLMTNLSFGAVVLGLVMARYGSGIGLLAAYFSGVAGNLAGLILYPKPYLGVGASGMMMGCLGLLAVQSFAIWRVNYKAGRFLITGILGGLLIFIMFGTNPGSDVIAHTGGFLMGGLMGAGLTLIPMPVVQNRNFNSFSLLCLISFVILAWFIALRH